MNQIIIDSQITIDEYHKDISTRLPNESKTFSFFFFF